VQPPDISEIVGQHLCDGKPVDRLIWKDASAMKAMSIEHGKHFRNALAAREKDGILPDRLNEMIRGYMPSRCILTALELDIFTAVGDGANAEQIGMRIHANARAVGILLNALVALGLLSKSGDNYRNTPESARFFVQDSKDNHRNGLLHTANIRGRRESHRRAGARDRWPTCPFLAPIVPFNFFVLIFSAVNEQNLPEALRWVE
jgi:hypothetical protein